MRPTLSHLSLLSQLPVDSVRNVTSVERRGLEGIAMGAVRPSVFGEDTMKLRNKIFAVVAATGLMLVGWAVPAAHAVEQNWQYDAPQCSSLTVTYPDGVSGNDANVKINGVGADDGKSVTLNFQDATGFSGTHAFDFESHSQWPGWDEWAVVWVQVDGTNYHWGENGEKPVTCGEPAPEPETYTVCSPIEKRGKITGWEPLEVSEPQLKVWPYADWDHNSSDGNCVKDVFVCWKINASDFPLNADGLPYANEKVFNPPQSFVQQVNGNAGFASLVDCYDYVAECGTTVFFQLDHYKLHNYSGYTLLEKLKREGLGWGGTPTTGGPGDAAIGHRHLFIKVDGECEPPPVDICVWDTETHQGVKTSIPANEFDSQVHVPWDEELKGDACAPPTVIICAEGANGWYGETLFDYQLPDEYDEWTGNPEDCFITPPNIDGSLVVGACVDGVPYFDYTIRLTDPDDQVAPGDKQTAIITFLHPSDASLNHAIEVDLTGGPNEWTGQELWPGAGVSPAAWPGWEQASDGTYTSVGDANFGWTRDGVDVKIELNPELVLTQVMYPDASPECDTPPPTDICVWDGTSASKVTIYGPVPEDATPWDDELANGGCDVPEPASLAGSLLNSICVADSPWMFYNINLHNPDGVPIAGVGPGESPTAKISFLNPNGADFVISDLAIGSGYFLWPGAKVEPAPGLTDADIDPTDPSTFVPTNWPGWYQDEAGNWFEHTDPQDDFGWTRNSVDVRIDVNPSTTFTVNYPPPSPVCAARPPEEFTIVAGAPPLPEAAPAVAVTAVATFAG